MTVFSSSDFGPRVAEPAEASVRCFFCAGSILGRGLAWLVVY